MLNGSSTDACAASDPGTRRIAGDPDCKRAMLRYSRETRDRLTKEILRKSA